MFSPLLNGLVRKSFKRLPTAAEWARFRKYARRMRELRDRNALTTLSLEVSSVMQLHAANEPLLPNITTLDLWDIREPSILFIPSLLSPTITTIFFGSLASHLPTSVIASVIANLPTHCPNLQDITFQYLPRNPMITAAVSNMFFAINRNTLWKFHVPSPLTEEAREAISKSQNLRRLLVVIEKGTSIPSASLPNLTHLQIKCGDGSDVLQLFRGATFGELDSVDFGIESKPIGDFFEAFNGATFSSSIWNTLSAIRLTTKWPWNPNYSSLLPFTRLVDLVILFPCDDVCSAVDDSIVINLSRAMPELRILRLGDDPCDKFTGGVTVKGLVALAHNCPNLSSLCIHLQVASLSDPPTGLKTTRDAGHSALWTGCALTKLEVGWIPVPERSASIVALTLLRIFPRIEFIEFVDKGWFEVEGLICRSKEILDCSSKYRHLTTLQSSLLTLLRSQSYDQ